jgi:hypothetical protein
MRIGKSRSSENHSIKTTKTAMLKIFERYLLSARADSKKISVKQMLNKIPCQPIGKNGIINIVKITKNNKPELLIVKNAFDTFEKNFILNPY